MPPKDENTVSESSNDTTLDAANPSEGVEGAEAESSTANDVKDTLSIVRDVVNEKTDDPSASSTEGEGDEGELEAGEQASRVSKEPDNEGFTDVPFHKHPRFREVLGQRNAFRADAESFRTLKTFMSDYGMTDQDAADALLTRAMVRSNPEEAWKRLKPTVEYLLQANGLILPPELEQRVQAGELPRDVALQLNQQQARATSLAQARDFDRQMAQTRGEREVVNARMDAAASWERDRAVKDPNFASKLEAIQKEVTWLQKVEGMPASPEAVRSMLDRAYKTVNAGFKAPAQRKQPVNSSTASQGSTTQNVAPASTIDIIRAQRARRAS